MRRIVPTLVLACALGACNGTDDGRPALPVSTVVVADDPGAAYLPAVSPDSTRLAWSKVIEGRSAIFIGNLDGTDAVRLTNGVWDYFPVWSPSGAWIVYHGEAPDYDLFIVPSGGGEPRQLTAGAGVDYPWYWLPDESGVVFTREGEGPAQTLVAPLDGGAIRPLVPGGSGNQFAALSPDGSKAAINVASGNGELIVLYDFGTGASTQLTTEGHEVMSLHPWSPDGRLVLFESGRTGTRDLWTADVQTGELRQLTTDIHDDDEARWSPDGRWIAFRSTRGGQPDIWLMAATGGTPQRVTNTGALEDGLLWLQDGSGLVFWRNSTIDRLQVVPSDGGPARTLLEWAEAPINHADVSSTAASVVFTSSRSGNLDVWSIPLEGGEPAALTVSPGADEFPQLSPDGASIVFHSHMGGTGDIWVMPVGSGGAPRQLMDWPSNETEPRWSPDGTMIAFLSDRDANRLDLWVVPADGGEARRLSANLGDVLDARWSPTSDAIFFIGRTATGTRDLYRVSASGGEPEAFGVNPFIGDGDLSPDGSHYAYSAFEAGWAFVEVVPTAGGMPTRLTPGTEGVFQEEVRWAKDGSLVLHDYVYASDSYDLHVVSWPGGEWRRLTNTPDASEYPWAATDTGEMIVVARNEVGEIVSVSVADLIAGANNR